MTDIRYSYNVEQNKLNIRKETDYVISLPEVEITQEQFLEFLDNVTVGKRYILHNDVLVLDAVFDIEQKKKALIRDRNSLLFASDWTMLPDVPLSEEKRNEWIAYRQQLRDITTDINFPNVTLLKCPF